jgi:tetratricopeptide (TPR) repeat protein
MRLISILYFTFCFFIATSQNVCSFSPEESNTAYCLSGYSNYKDNINASLVVENILSKINLKNTFFVTKVCEGINNAIAINYNDVKYILLDVDWIESIKYGKNDWFHLMVIGHEMAHHILKHTEKQVGSLQESRMHELEADEFSGYILGMYGASQADINTLLLGFPDDNDVNSTHPQKKDRELAIQKGYSSTKQNERNALLQAITQNADFNLKTIPFLLSMGRQKFHSFLLSYDKVLLYQAIELYQEAIRFTDDPQIAYELGAMFYADGDLVKYHASLELAYQITKDEKYIIELLGNCLQSSDVNLDNVILKYKMIINNINPVNIKQVPCLISMAKYYMYLVHKDFDKNGFNKAYIEKAKDILKDALKIIENKEILDQEIYNQRAEINSSLGLCLLWQEDFSQSLDCLIKSKVDFEYAEKIQSEQLEKIYAYYSNNLLISYSNLALAYLRQREWNNSLQAISKYESILSSLTEEKKDYLNKIKAIRMEDIYYFKGRSLHGIKQYEDAVKNYTLAINDKKGNSGYLYFYRGISFLGLNKSNQACSDFNEACKSGFVGGCDRIKSSCKN